MDAIDAAEREAKAAQEKLLASRERLAKMRAAPPASTGMGIHQPVFEPEKPEENCFTKCLGAPKPTTVQPTVRAPTKETALEALQKEMVNAGQTAQYEMEKARLEQMRLRGEVQDSRTRIETAVRQQLSGLDPADAASARVEMWTLLLKQVVSGMGAPQQEQLELLWRKYDANHDGKLQRNELVLIIKDHATSMHDALTTRDLPKVRAALAKQPGNFLLEMQLKTLEQQEIVLRAQKGGKIDGAASDKIFDALDLDHDGTVTREEFITRAPQVFYGAQMLAVGLGDGMQKAMEEMPAECKQQ